MTAPRIRRALDVVAHPVTGAAACASVLNGADPGCVPLNVWALDAVTPEASAYTEVPASSRALTSLQVIGGTVSASLGDYGVQLPGAARLSRSPWDSSGERRSSTSRRTRSSRALSGRASRSAP